jgi:molybdenum cofactor cytidylyltransferase
VATGLKLEAIVLAAGMGTRFGGGKLTAAFEGGRLIDGALAAAKAAPVRGVTVMVGADARVAAVAEEAGLRVVEATDYAAGLSASLRAGIASLPDDADGAFIFLGDMPRIPVEVLAQLADAMPGHAAAAPVFDGQRGHPVLIGRELFDKVMGLTGDAGAGAVLAALGERLALVQTEDAGVLFDVDAPLRPLHQ